MPTTPFLWMKPGMMPILHSPGVMTPGQLGPISRVAELASAALTRTMSLTGHALGDAHDQLDAGVGRLEDGIRGARRRHVDHAGGGAGRAHRVLHRVEHRQAEVPLAAAPGRDAADQLGAVGEAASE